MEERALRIVIDARMLYWTGVALYTRELLSQLEKLDRINEYLVLVRPDDWDKWSPRSGNFHKIKVDMNPYTLAEQMLLPGIVRGLNPDLVHFTAPNTPLLYRGRRVVTVHDLTLLDFDTSRGAGVGKLLRGLKRLPFRLVFWNDVRGSRYIFTVTNYVRGQLIVRWRVPDDRIVVTPNAIDAQWDDPEPVDKYDAGDEYILYVGNYYPYKNVGSSVEAFAEVAPKFPKLRLVLAGQADVFRSELARKVKEMGLQERVVFTGRVTDGEKMSLFQGAKVYLNPSLSEGFGLQGLEAMAMGAPVLAADATCLPEVYGDAALYFDPHDTHDQAQKLTKLLSNDDLRQRLVLAGKERLKHFSWRDTAKKTLEAYKKAARR
jgi:glycosyltransferase involved in cell wall biosynthesis